MKTALEAPRGPVCPAAVKTATLQSVRFGVPFDPSMSDSNETALRLFGRPALAARKGSRRGGPGEGPLKGPFPGASAPLASACRRAVDAVALAVWRRLPRSLQHARLPRRLLLTRAARHANRPEATR